MERFGWTIEERTAGRLRARKPGRHTVTVVSAAADAAREALAVACLEQDAEAGEDVAEALAEARREMRAGQILRPYRAGAIRDVLALDKLVQAGFSISEAAQRLGGE